MNLNLSKINIFIYKQILLLIFFSDDCLIKINEINM